MKLELFVGSLLVLLAAGCGDQPSPVTPAAEVRGEPIATTAVRPIDLNTPPAVSASASASASVSVSFRSNVSAVSAAAALPVTPLTSGSAPVSGAPKATPAQPSAAAGSGGSGGFSPDAAGAIKAATKPDTGPMGYPLVGFDKLAGYTIEISDDLLGPVTNDLALISAKTDSLIPDSVKAYSKKHVSLRGFMLPLKVEGGLVTELLIMKDQSMCCYGTVPKIHEWVSVKMSEKGVKPVMDQPITLFGTLHVGEMRENGYLTGIYRLDGERMAPPEE